MVTTYLCIEALEENLVERMTFLQYVCVSRVGAEVLINTTQSAWQLVSILHTCILRTTTSDQFDEILTFEILCFSSSSFTSFPAKGITNISIHFVFQYFE